MKQRYLDSSIFAFYLITPTPTPPTTKKKEKKTRNRPWFITEMKLTMSLELQVKFL